DIAPVAGVFRGPYVMVVNTSVPASTVPEFIAYAKANPGKISMASSGVGAGAHLAGELFGRHRHGPRALSRWRAGGHRSHRRAGAGLLRHHCLVDRVCQDWQAGALAVTTAARSEALPDIPTVPGFVPGYEASGWFGLGAPKGTPVEIIDMLNKEINAALADPKMKARLADLGGTVLAGSPADFGKLIAEETEKWAKVIRAA